MKIVQQHYTDEHEFSHILEGKRYSARIYTERDEGNNLEMNFAILQLVNKMQEEIDEIKKVVTSFRNKDKFAIEDIKELLEVINSRERATYQILEK